MYPPAAPVAPRDIAVPRGEGRAAERRDPFGVEEALSGPQADGGQAQLPGAQVSVTHQTQWVLDAPGWPREQVRGPGRLA